MEFFSIWGTEKVAGLWFATGGSAPRLTLCLPSPMPEPLWLHIKSPVASFFVINSEFFTTLFLPWAKECIYMETRVCIFNLHKGS